MFTYFDKFYKLFAFIFEKNSFNDKINYLKQLKIGKTTSDYFSIVDFACEQNINPHQTIKDYDYLNYKFQKEHNTKVREKYDALYLQGDWFRALPFDSYKNHRVLLYGTLISLRAFVIDKIYDKIEDYLNKILPHEYVSPYNEPLFKPTEDKKLFTLTEYELRAGGKEEVLKSIKKHAYSVLYNEIEEKAIELSNYFKNYTFIEEDNDLSATYIIPSFKLAEEITFENFFYKFQEYKQPIELVYNEIDKYFENIKDKINQEITKIEKK